MITPGRFRHFKGAEYRVLFTAIWLDAPQPRSEAPCYVYVDGGKSPPLIVCAYEQPTEYFQHVLTPLWAGGSRGDVVHGDRVIVYCDLDGVFARTEAEFEEIVPAPNCKRFIRVGA